ncbi:hypothetical protein Q5P01_008579 [Channa striata]|uniref:Uncharacterized protein n=1 Tax=Channa striata TaxID=64152 RepID=A0AA88N2A5_CHASR|nr:hypothetical protein Q5P01_008579 [Channa striata]
MPISQTSDICTGLRLGRIKATDLCGNTNPPPGLRKTIATIRHENYVTEGDFETLPSKRSHSVLNLPKCACPCLLCEHVTLCGRYRPPTTISCQRTRRGQKATVQSDEEM